MKIKIIRENRVSVFEENVNHFLSVIDDPKHAYKVVDVKLHMSQEGATNYYNALITYEKIKRQLPYSGMTQEERDDLKEKAKVFREKELDRLREESRYTPEETAQLKAQEFAELTSTKQKIAEKKANENSQVKPKNSTKASAKA